MRAKTIDFERGQDPKRSMGIGTPNLDNLDYKWKELEESEIDYSFQGYPAWKTNYKGYDFIFHGYATTLTIILDNKECILKEHIKERKEDRNKGEGYKTYLGAAEERIREFLEPL